MSSYKMSGLAVVLSFFCGAGALAFAVGDLRLLLLGRMDLDRWWPFAPTLTLLFFMYAIRRVDEASSRL